MKRILTITILHFCLNNLFAQTIRDSVFNDVILIKNTDVSTNGFHFLVDIPIKPQKEPIVIFNNDFRIPTKLFFNRNSFLYGQNELILITTDWVFEKEIREREKREGIHIKAHQNKIYYIKRSGSGYEIDSLSIVMHDPRKAIKMNFKNPELKENEVKYFFQECYGSTCCPKDENWDFQQERNEMKNDFNKKHNVNVHKNVYRQVLGRESEHCDYYTLSDLTNEQKIAYFRTPKPIPNSHLKDFDFSPIIILPNIIDTTNLIHKNPQKTPKNNNPKKAVSGYVYTEDDIYVSMSDIKIQVKGAENERYTIPNFDGNFEIEVRKDEVLIIRYYTYSKEIIITDENTYVISLNDKK